MEQNLPEINKQNEERKYNFGIDIIKILAMCFVIIGHAILFNGGFSKNPFSESIEVVLSNLIYNIMFCSIGLFILITGYLGLKNKPNASYFKKLIVYITEYILCSIIAWLVRVYILKQSISFCDGIRYILKFQMISYSWYINMFIGLFLLSPFLNSLYFGLKSQKQKHSLLMVLFVIVCIPTTFNIAGFNFWKQIYPIFYYFIGLYIYEYRPKIKKVYLALLILFVAICELAIINYSSILNITPLVNGGVYGTAMSILIFLMFYDIKSMQNKTRPVIRKIASLSLSTFLISFLFDELSFVIMSANGLFTFIDRLPHLLYITPLILFLSIFISFLVHELTKILISVIRIIINLLKKLKLVDK